jgi:hypothetical protein
MSTNNTTTNATKPKKKYSGAGFFIENDEFDCFVDDNKHQAKDSTQAPQKAQQQTPEQLAANQPFGNAQTNNYFMYGNNFQNQMFPMFPVPMNMPMMNMMNFGNMMYMNDPSKNMYDNEFNEFMTMPLEQVLEKFDEKIKDQHGCKQLQARIENEKNNSKFFAAIFDLIIQKFKEYSDDQFANYLCQKIVEFSNPQQLARVVDILLPEILDMSASSHGTRVIQKVIENVEEDEIIENILNEYKGHVVEMVMDGNGNHVIQKCLSYFMPKQVGFMYDEIMEDSLRVATHKHGCCVLQRCIDYCNEEQIKFVINGILKHTDSLVNDKYGNYVIQYILELQGYNEYKTAIGKIVVKQVKHYCYLKYSSNVIEKSIKVGITQVFEKFLEALDDTEELQKMLCDQFGNYVIQTALLRNRNDQKIKPVLNSIKAVSNEVNNNEIGSKVLQKLGRVFDFWGSEEVKLKEQSDRDNYKGNRKGRKGYFKKRNYNNNYNRNFGNNNQNMMMYPMDSNNGYVNMNMNLNFNVNLNYQNQGQSNAAGQGQ